MRNVILTDIRRAQSKKSLIVSKKITPDIMNL